ALAHRPPKYYPGQKLDRIIDFLTSCPRPENSVLPFIRPVLRLRENYPLHDLAGILAQKDKREVLVLHWLSLTKENAVLGAIKFKTEAFVLIGIMSPHQYVIPDLAEAGYAGFIDFFLNIFAHTLQCPDGH